MKKTKIAIVVPTIREESIKKFIDEWEIDKCANSSDFNIHLFIVEDNPTKQFNIYGINVTHLSHEHIEKEFPYPEIIGRKTDAVRIFGFWKAWKEGFDYILTLDDDCYPNRPQYKPLIELINYHLDNFKKPVSNPALFKTLNKGFARGTPSFIKNKCPVGLSIGLWTGVPDIDGKTQLFYDQEELPYPSGRLANEVVPKNQLIPICGMHLFFPIEYVKYIYYFPTLNTYYRWADIWMGFCIKKIFDAKGIAIKYGPGTIYHSRASNAQRNFELESTNNGYEVNDKLAKCMIETQLQQDDIISYIDDLFQTLEYFGESNNLDYFKKIADMYEKWYYLFERNTINSR